MKNNVIYLDTMPNKLGEMTDQHKDYLVCISQLTSYQMTVIDSEIPLDFKVHIVEMGELADSHMKLKTAIHAWVTNLYDMLGTTPETLKNEVKAVVDLSIIADKFLDILISDYSDSAKKSLGSYVSQMGLHANVAKSAVDILIEKIKNIKDNDLKNAHEGYSSIVSIIQKNVNADNKLLQEYGIELEKLDKEINKLAAVIVIAIAGLGASLILMALATPMVFFMIAIGLVAAAYVAVIALASQKIVDSKNSIEKTTNKMDTITRDVAKLKQIDTTFSNIVNLSHTLISTLTKISKLWKGISEELHILEGDIKEATEEVSANKWCEVKGSMNAVRASCTKLLETYEVVKIVKYEVSTGKVELGMTEEQITKIALNSKTIPFEDYVKNLNLKVV